MKIQIKKLKHHPFNSKVYILSDIEILKKSIMDIGLLEPLVINKKNEVLSGNRRLEALRSLDIEEVEVVIKELKIKDEPLHIISHNSQRVKTSREILNEIKILSRYFKKRQGFRSDLTSVDTNRSGNREKLSKELGVSGDKIYKLMYIDKIFPKLIDLIDKGSLTINQSYIEAKRRLNQETIYSKDLLNDSIKILNKKYKIYNKSSKDMCELEEKSVDMVLTSPPYYSQRDYGDKDQIGLENTVDKYIKSLMEVFNECYRVLSDEGSCWVVIGDSYIDGCLRSIPHRFAIEMMNLGWIQRNCIIWHKTNPKPESVKTRLGTSNEFIFFFTKKKHNYYFDVDSIRVPYKQKDPEDVKSPRHHNIHGKIQRHTSILQNVIGKIPLDFIEHSKHSKPIGRKFGIPNIEHIAVYPKELCYLPIRCGSKKYDTILDPFSGSGTTGIVSLELERKFIGYELNKRFVELSYERINDTLNHK